MPFNPNAAEDFVNPAFNPEGAEDYVNPRFNKEGAQAAARAAFQRSHDSPESVRRRELDAKGPVSRYFSEWGDDLGRQFDRPLVSEKGLGHDLLQGNLGLLETAASLGTGVTSLVTEPVQELLTGRDVPRGSHVYQPRSEGGRAQADFIGAVSKPAMDLVQEVPTQAAAGAEAAGASPETARELGEGAGRVFEAAAVAAPFKGKAGAPAVAPGAEGVQAGRAATGTVTNKLPKGGAGVMGEARALGFKIDPRTAAMQPERQGMAQTGVIRQDLAGPGMKGRFEVENQKIANAHAAREVALDPNKPLSQQIKPALEQHAKLRQEVANVTPVLIPDSEFAAAADALGARLRDNPALATVPQIEKLRELFKNIETMSGQQALDAISEYRASSKVGLQSIDDFQKHQVARAERDAANALEGLLERSATAGGRPELVEAFRKSRVRAAKIHDIDNALIGDNLNMAALKNIGSENLTGKLQQLARVAEEFPELTRTQSKIAGGSQSLTPSPWIGYRAAGRFLGKGVGDRLISEKFQRRFGDVAEDTGITGRAPEPPAAPDTSVPFEPTGGLPPGRAFRNRGPIGPEVEPTQFTGELLDMPTNTRPGDLTAEQVPPTRGDIDFQPTNFDLASELGLADETGFFPGARVPEEAATTEFVSDQPINRRRNPESMAFAGEERRINGVPDRSAERQRVLERPIGTKPNAGLADELLNDPEFAAAVRGDTRSNRLELHPDDQMPPPLTDKEMLDLGTAPGYAELEAPRGRAAADVADEIDPLDERSAPEIEASRTSFMPPVVNEMMGAAGESMKQLRGEVQNVKYDYGTGEISFDFQGKRRVIEDDGNSPLVDDMGDERMQSYLLKRVLDEGTKRRSASDIVNEMTKLRESKPRPLNKMYGPNPTDAQKASHAKAMREWDAKYRKLKKEHGPALERDNAEFRAKNKKD